MVRINAVMPEDTLQKIDRLAKEKRKSRSSFLREAADKLIEEYEREKKEEQRKKRVARAIDVQDRLRTKAEKWDGVSEVRKWRELRK